MNPTSLPLVSRLRPRGLPLRLRHRRHLRRRTDHPGALGPEPGHARPGDGRGAVRHRARVADRRLADGPVRPQADVDRRSASSTSLSAFGCAFADGVGTFIAARFLGGLGIGISTVAAPLYISEIAPPAFRGRLAGMFQFNIVFGIVARVRVERDHRPASVATTRGAGCSGSPPCRRSSTRVMCFGLPESPRWLHRPARAIARRASPC